MNNHLGEESPHLLDHVSETFGEESPNLLDHVSEIFGEELSHLLDHVSKTFPFLDLSAWIRPPLV